MSDLTGRERLILALQAKRGVPLELLVKATQGWYDEYGDNDNPNAPALPITALVHDLMEAGLNDLADLAIEGAFDASRAESDAWAASPEGVLAEQEFGANPGNPMHRLASISPELNRPVNRKYKPNGRA